MEIILDGERGISWNKLYKQKHWSYRKRMADAIHSLVIYSIRSQYDEVIQFVAPVDITIKATYKRSPVDADNICAKLYIDGLVRAGVIEDDDPKHVSSVTLMSRKGSSNNVVITIEEVKE